jgi:hypothetical protein
MCAFFVDSVPGFPQDCFQSVLGTTQQPIPEAAMHEVEVGAHDMFVKAVCDPFHSIFISIFFPEYVTRITHIMVQVTRHYGCGRWLMAPA